ncbi:MAG TPA: metalloregulator ArsR/SmtB family transcription factor [Pseudonocardiaceae bacterium]|jgi:DNA-binding transcriptional ArsR family regulator|nr:metalloregulator ArsR/SmtB family transcription factor [Pseudonocardiaceae bacterium]
MQTVQLAEVAAVLADPSRATMCLALIDGRAWTVGELARTAAIAPSTASEHVRALTEAGFVEGVRQGRHRYVRITDPRVAELIERLAEHAEHREPRSLTASVRARRLSFARTCYDHLAGALGVALRDGMLRDGLIDQRAGLALTPEGEQRLDDLGVPRTEPGSRPLLRECLDWTERREHLGGALPATLLDHALQAGWLDRDQHRAVRIHPSAHGPLVRLGVDLEALPSM